MVYREIKEFLLNLKNIIVVLFFFFLAKCSLWGRSCEKPNLIFDKQYIAFKWSISSKICDINKPDLSVLYMTYLSLLAMESDHSCLYAVKSLFFKALITFCRLLGWIHIYITQSTRTKPMFCDFARVGNIALCMISVENDKKAEVTSILHIWQKRGQTGDIVQFHHTP